MTPTEAAPFLLAWIIGAIIGAAILFAIIRWAVVSGLRSHALWKGSGEYDRALAQRKKELGEGTRHPTD